LLNVGSYEGGGAVNLLAGKGTGAFTNSEKETWRGACLPDLKKVEGRRRKKEEPFLYLFVRKAVSPSKNLGGKKNRRGGKSREKLEVLKGRGKNVSNKYWEKDGIE